MLRIVKIWVVIAAAVAVGAAPGLAGNGPRDAIGGAAAAPVIQSAAIPHSAQPPPGPRPHLVQGGACADACRSQFNQCRVSTKGDPRCNAALTGCLQRCISGKGR